VSATGRLAEFVSCLDARDIPEAVLHQARRCLIDWLGVTLAGSADPSAAIVRGAAAELGTDRTTSIVGTADKAGLLPAVLANGYAAHVLDYDDTYNPARTTVHGSAPVWPVVLALSEHEPVSGPRALAAFVAGFESEVRIARAAGPAHYEQGWHVTGTVGHFGGAAAAANLLGLDAEQIAHAFGAAGTQAAGLKGVYGSMGKPLHPGKAAMDGLLAALLARRGFTATTTILDDERGFLQVLSPDPDIGFVTERLGQTWTLLDNGFKPYACGSLTHPTIEAVIDLCTDHGFHHDEIVTIEATVNDYVSWVTGKATPTSGLAGKFSIFHCAAVAAIDGAASIRQFDDERVNDPTVVSMRDRVRIVVDDDLPKDAAVVTVVLTDGRRLTRDVRHNKGTPGKPMTDVEIEGKFLDLATPRLGPQTARRLVDTCWQVERCESVAGIARLATGETGVR
jgi:2-methylcitrate dehydratase PrpD